MHQNTTKLNLKHRPRENHKNHHRHLHGNRTTNDKNKNKNLKRKKSKLPQHSLPYKNRFSQQKSGKNCVEMGGRERDGETVPCLSIAWIRREEEEKGTIDIVSEENLTNPRFSNTRKEEETRERKWLICMQQIGPFSSWFWGRWWEKVDSSSYGVFSFFTSLSFLFSLFFCSQGRS